MARTWCKKLCLTMWIIRQQHIKNFEIKKSGLLVRADIPQLAASPDGVVHCECCGQGLVDVKFPFYLKDPVNTLLGYSKLKDSCLFNLKDEGFALNSNHSNYYQVQCQLFVSGMPYCDFCLWWKNFLFLQRITRDDNSLSKNVTKALLFHKKVVIPELLGRIYTKTDSV